MISVVHIYSKDDSMTANYVSMLTKAIAHRVDSYIADDATSLKEIIKKHHPDIIHQHGEVTYSMPENARRILTTHGSTAYRDNMAYYVIIARSRMEANTIDKPRTEILRNPIITKTATFEETANRMVDIYRKVMDSDVLPLMDDDTITAMKLMLRAAIFGDRRWVADQTMSATIDWRKLMIYTYYEQVDDYLRQGAQIMGLEVPPYEVQAKTAYLPDTYHRLSNDIDCSVMKLLERIQKGEVTMLRLVQLCIALLQEDLDEEKLLQELDSGKFIPLFTSVLQILKEQFLLSEGFWPCMPADNHLTRHLRTQLTNHLKL